MLEKLEKQDPALKEKQYLQKHQELRERILDELLHDCKDVNTLVKTWQDISKQPSQEVSKIITLKL